MDAFKALGIYGFFPSTLDNAEIEHDWCLMSFVMNMEWNDNLGRRLQEVNMDTTELKSMDLSANSTSNMTETMEDYLLKMFEEAMNETNQDLFNETATNSSDYATYEETMAAYFEQMLNESLYAN